MFPCSRRPRVREVRALVIWATPFHLDDLGSKKQEDDEPLPGKAFFKDLPKHRLLPVLPRVSNCMVIHGEKDELVPVDQAWEIFQGLSGPKEIHVIEGADHRLTQPHPPPAGHGPHRGVAQEIPLNVPVRSTLEFTPGAFSLGSRSAEGVDHCPQTSIPGSSTPPPLHPRAKSRISACRHNVGAGSFYR